MTTFSISELKRINAGLCAGINSLTPLAYLSSLEKFVNSLKNKQFDYSGEYHTTESKLNLTELDKAVNKILLENKIVIVCCSGGVDSQTLLHLCAKNTNKKLLMAFHLNHGLREDADIEQELVKTTCELYGVKLWTKKLDQAPNTNSFETWARRHRMSFMDDVKNSVKLLYGEDPVFLTAHHAGDQSETVLMRIQRGTGLVGLQGIRDSHTLKPLLDFEKNLFYKYCKKHNITLLEDYTNSDLTISRNAIRNNLQNSCKSISNLLYNISLNSSDYVNICEKLALKKFPNIINIFDISEFDNSEESLIILRYSLNAVYDLNGFWSTRIIKAFNSFMLSNNKKITLSNFEFIKAENKLYLIDKRQV